jgi:hypothetical protein
VCHASDFPCFRRRIPRPKFDVPDAPFTCEGRCSFWHSSSFRCALAALRNQQGRCPLPAEPSGPGVIPGARRRANGEAYPPAVAEWCYDDAARGEVNQFSDVASGVANLWERFFGERGGIRRGRAQERRE